MSNDYDTILKEKKVYEEVSDDKKHKYFKLFIFFGILISLLIIAVSYAIFYNTVLDSESIFLNNIINVKKDYSLIYKDIKFNHSLDGNFIIEGSIDVGNDNYGYSFAKDNNKVKRTLFSGDRILTYYYDGKDSYVKMSNLGDFYIKEKNELNNLKYYNNVRKNIKNDFNNYIYDSILGNNTYDFFNQLYNIDNLNEILKNIETNFNTYVTSDKYARKVYFSGNKPVVEINLVLNKVDINNILGTSSGLQLSDNYQLNITMKNDAISNSIYEIKVVINNKSKNSREVLSYKSKVINYTDSKGDKYSIKYLKDKNSIQIKKNNVLYSVVQISSKNKTNIYNYRKINKIYTVGLSVEKVRNNFEYGIETNIDNVAKAVKVTGEYKKGKTINENIEKSVSIDSLSIEQQNTYKKTIADVFS